MSPNCFNPPDFACFSPSISLTSQLCYMTYMATREQVKVCSFPPYPKPSLNSAHSLDNNSATFQCFFLSYYLDTHFSLPQSSAFQSSPNTIFYQQLYLNLQDGTSDKTFLYVPSPKSPCIFYLFAYLFVFIQTNWFLWLFISWPHYPHPCSLHPLACSILTPIVVHTHYIYIHIHMCINSTYEIFHLRDKTLICLSGPGASTFLFTPWFYFSLGLGQQIGRTRASTTALCHYLN